MITIPKPNTRLLHYLEQQMTAIENDKSSTKKAVLVPLLQQAVEGLVALRYGEVQAIFAPSDRKGSKDGTKPYTLRVLRMKALGFADLLISKDYKGHVIRTIGGAYGEKAGTVRKWRLSKRLGKTSDLWMRHFSEEISKQHWDEAHVIDELKTTGARYKQEKKLAHKSKK
jgi:hypothetical protein